MPRYSRQLHAASLRALCSSRSRVSDSSQIRRYAERDEDTAKTKNRRKGCKTRPTAKTRRTGCVDGRDLHAICKEQRLSTARNCRIRHFFVTASFGDYRTSLGGRQLRR